METGVKDFSNFSSACLSWPLIEFILEEAALDRAVKQDDPPGGPQADTFGEVRAAGEEIGGVAGAALLHDIADLPVKRFQLFFLAEPPPVWRVKE
jgi:hypothetical protein